MSEMSNYLENELIDHVFRNAAYTSPTTVYVALHTADPGEAGGNELPVLNGYARVAVTFGAPSDGSSTNSGSVSFTASGGNWGTITHFSIQDAASAGNMLVYSPLDTSRVINDGDTLQFNAAAITVTFA